MEQLGYNLLFTWEWTGGHRVGSTATIDSTSWLCPGFRVPDAHPCGWPAEILAPQLCGVVTEGWNLGDGNLIVKYARLDNVGHHGELLHV